MQEVHARRNYNIFHGHSLYHQLSLQQYHIHLNLYPLLSSQYFQFNYVISYLPLTFTKRSSTLSYYKLILLHCHWQRLIIMYHRSPKPLNHNKYQSTINQSLYAAIAFIVSYVLICYLKSHIFAIYSHSHNHHQCHNHHHLYHFH